MRGNVDTWSHDELVKVGGAEELDITTLRRDGTARKPVTIWVVRVGDNIYVRSGYGLAAAWYRGALAHREGRIEAGGIGKDVTFADTDPAVADAIDAAYRAKYRHYGAQYVDSVTTPEARSATIRLVPR